MLTDGGVCAELMDRPDLPLDETVRALSDLERVNRWTFGLLPTLRAVGPLLARGPRRQLLLDVGTGSGQVAAALKRVAGRSRREVDVIGLDRKLSHLLFARRRGAVTSAVVASADALPFAEGAVDWALSTLLLHHFDRDDGRALIDEMVRVSSRGAAIIDLRRSWLASLLIRLILPILGVARVASHDGKLSADSAWSLPQVRKLVDDLPVSELERRFPLRFSLVIEPAAVER